MHERAPSKEPEESDEVLAYEAERVRDLATMTRSARTSLRARLLAYAHPDLHVGWEDDVVAEFDEVEGYIEAFTHRARHHLDAFVDLFRMLDAWTMEAR